MKNLILIIILLSPMFFISLGQASELDTFHPAPSQETQLDRKPAASPGSLGIPIYPDAKELTGDTLSQGGFEARSFVFYVSAPFQKVLKFYKERLGYRVEPAYLKNKSGKETVLFHVIAGSESRNVILEEMAQNETRLTLTVFGGGGGVPGE